MLDPQQWARECFGSVRLGDIRRTRRLVQMATSVASSPAGTVTAVFSGEAERQGAYDFLESEHVKADDLEKGVGEIVGARCAEHQELVVVVDGSQLSLSDFYGKRRLGKVGGYNADGAGLSVMSALALTPDGVPVGLLRQVMWSRPRRRPKKRAHASARPVEEKETMHWLDAIETSAERVASRSGSTRLTYVLDRQADTDAVICSLARTGHRFVLRSRNRIAFAGERRGLLRALLAWTKFAGDYEIEIAGRDGRAARTALLTVRYVDVVLRMKDPLSKEQFEVHATAVNAREMGQPPPGEERIDWLLLTNQRVDDFEAARKVIATYSLRWRIEDFHKSWKSGHCHVEDNQLRGEQAVRKWALILATAACRVERLKLLSRATPDVLADTEFSEIELHALILLKRRSKKRTEEIPDAVPTLGEATRWLAEIGGYTGKSSGGPPGSITLSRGLFRLRAAADAIAAVLAD